MCWEGGKVFRKLGTQNGSESTRIQILEEWVHIPDEEAIISITDLKTGTLKHR